MLLRPRTDSKWHKAGHLSSSVDLLGTNRRQLLVSAGLRPAVLGSKAKRGGGELSKENARALACTGDCEFPELQMDTVNVRVFPMPR